MIIRSRFTRIRTALAIAAALVLLAVGVGLTLLTVTPGVEAQSAPATPLSVTITRADGTVTASWDAVSGATKYHATYTTDNGGSWHAPVANHTNITDNSITFNGDNAKTYVVGLRAGNDNGWSGWRNSPASGPYTPPGQTPTPTPTPAPNPPGPVSSVTLTRSDGALAASWPAVSTATHYHVTYTVSGSGNWLLAALNHTGSSIDIAGVDNEKRYVVGVRAGNADGWSGWVNSPATTVYKPPKGVSPPAAPAAVTLTRSDGSVTATWPGVSEATKYHVAQSTNLGQSWHRLETDYTATSLAFNANNNLTYMVAVMSVNDDGESEWRDSVPAGPYTPPPAAPTRLTAHGGDQIVVLAWHDPGNSSITGYEYQVNHNDTATGNLSGWSSWQSIADSDADTTAHTLTGLTNGKEYRFKLRAINATGASKPAPQFARWYVSATPNIPTPTGLSVTPGDGYLDISWDAVTDATGYDVRAKTSGSSDWHDVASNVTGTSHRYTTNDIIDYVAVRARNANGAGAWAELSNGPPSDWLTTVRQSGASAQSVRAQSQLSAPTLGTITRDNDTRANGGDQSITLNWTSVTGATGYNVACSYEAGWTWWDCGAITSGSTTTHTVDNGEDGNDLVKTRTYRVSVRAVNNTPADASAWVNSVNIRPVIARLGSLTATRSDGSITLSWTPNSYTTGYNIDCAEADMNPPHSTSAYTRCATLTGQVDTATQHSVTIPHSSNSTYTVDNAKTYDIKITSTNTWGQAEWLAPLVAPLRMTATNVGLTAATLNIPSSYTGAWWYKRTSPSDDTTCHSVTAGTTTASLSSLTEGVNYTYKAYDKANCNSADEFASASFSTGANVSNLSATSDGVGFSVKSLAYQGIGFTTGDNDGGYTLQSVAVRFLATTGGRTPSGLSVAVHQEGGGGYPSDDALHTLSGTDPAGSAGEYTFTCSGSCSLSKETTYLLVLTANHSTDAYLWDTTATFTETNAPTNFGWSIADEARTNYSGTWSTDNTWTGVFKVTATKNHTLTASDVIANKATLTITNYSGDWYYMATSGPHATCQGPVSAASANLENLTKGNTYTYSAYNDGECRAANLLVTAAAFTTPSIVVSGIGTTSATIRMSNYSGAWYYKADSGPHSTCQSVANPRSPVTLSGLSEGTPYLYKAYSTSGCAGTDYITEVYFTTTTVGLTASNITNSAATLTIAGHSSDWYYQADATPDNTCKGPVSNSTTKNLTGLTSGTSYTYKAYSDSSCTTGNLLATAKSFTTGVSYASNLNSAKTGQSVIGITTKQAVAFTTGSNANGYTLTKVTAPLREISDGGNLTVKLHQMQGSGTYDTSSSPSATILATLSGTDPSSAAWADTTYTCSGSGCSLSASTTYFVVIESDRTDSFAWAFASTSAEFTYPTNSGWDIGYAHDKPSARPWYADGDYHPVRVEFTTSP